MDSSPFPDPTPSSSSSSFPHGKPARFDARALLFDESMEEEPSMAGTSVLGSSDDGAGRFPPSSGPRRRSSSRGSHKGKEREREADSVGHDDKLENRLASLHVNGDEAPADGAETEKDDANRPESAEEQEERRQQRRNDALTRERDGLAYMNTILEKALEGFERAVPGVERLSKTIGTTHELLDTYVKVLSQAQHTQSLLLDPEWEVAKDEEFVQKEEEERLRLEREEEERIAQEEHDRRERERKEQEEVERRAYLAANPPSTVRGRGRGLVRGRAGVVGSGTRGRGTGTAVKPNSTRGSGTAMGSGRGSGISRGTSRVYS